MKRPPTVPSRSGGKPENAPLGKRQVGRERRADRTAGDRPLIPPLTKKPGPKPKKIATRSRTRRGKKQAERTIPVLMARQSPKRDKWYNAARTLYVDQSLTLRAIAKKMPVGATTLGKWARKGGWEAHRQALHTSPQGLVTDLEMALRKLVDDLGEHVKSGKRPWKGAADEINKLVNVIERLRGDIYFPQHLSKTVHLLTAYLRDVVKKDELMTGLADILMGFMSWAMSAR